ncbi:MAG: hypothetical protein DRP57_10410 [Spirochaetes bacterium]|nr:MAG: hypothetical protein DRP57_10410 [Spirochaetota bacterium]
MKAAILTEPKKIEIQDVKRPAIKSGEVLVKIKACGICTLEQRLYTGDIKLFYPLIPGHEASGEIVEISEEGVLSDFKPGMRVALDLVNRCGECYYCRTGKSNQCINRFKKGQQVLGGFGEYIAVKSKQIFTIPDTLTYEEAAFSEPVACCVHSLKKIDLKLAEDLLIIGAGPMGQMHLQVALAMGARVFVSDPDADRRKQAVKSGAFMALNPEKDNIKEIIEENTEGRGADACVITSPSHKALQTGIDSVSKTGRINIYTSYLDAPVLPIDANTIHRSEKLITGSEGRTEYDFLTAVRLLSFGIINVKPLISMKVPITDIDYGFEKAMSRDTYRVILINNGN